LQNDFFANFLHCAFAALVGHSIKAHMHITGQTENTFGWNFSSMVFCLTHLWGKVSKCTLRARQKTSLACILGAWPHFKTFIFDVFLHGVFLDKPPAESVKVHLLCQTAAASFAGTSA